MLDLIAEKEALWGKYNERRANFDFDTSGVFERAEKNLWDEYHNMLFLRTHTRLTPHIQQLQNCKYRCLIID